MLDGCEWNVRLSAVDNRTILDKFLVTFEQYWQDTESFETYDRARFLEVTQRRDPARDALAQAVRLMPLPHQQAALDALAMERAHGHHRNLVVAATGTGKTVVAALDYARLRKQMGGDATLLFVAHREEILDRSLARYRAAVRDGHFGEKLVGRHKPRDGRHVFASIQSLHAARLAELRPDAYDVVVIDEFHHAAAHSYDALLRQLEPRILLGLTATPERADGRSVLGWFDGRIATELRLWDALDQGLVSPFQYFGIHDGTDLSAVDFTIGRYDVAMLEKVYTADHVRASLVLRAVHDYVRHPRAMRALGFCVSVAHAEFMAAFLNEKGLPSLAVHADTTEADRRLALQKLGDGTVNVVFAKDLFNEGVDVPAVDTVLFLRPTESATIFLQQLGRGLRLEEGKSCLTVLDFIGNAHRKFRFLDRFKALSRGTRAEVRRAIEDGFPHLPSGCDIRLDNESRAIVLANAAPLRASPFGARSGADGLPMPRLTDGAGCPQLARGHWLPSRAVPVRRPGSRCKLSSWPLTRRRAEGSHPTAAPMNASPTTPWPRTGRECARRSSPGATSRSRCGGMRFQRRVAVSASSGSLPPSTGSSSSAWFKYCSRDSIRASPSTATVSDLERARTTQRYIQEGRRWVVDVDLEAFFDRVNHDVLMSRLAKRITDRRVLGLIRRYLNAGIMASGVVMDRHEGTPQGGPLSPLLANALLDEVDRQPRPAEARCHLNSLNRRMRTRTSGGVGGN